MIEKHTALQVPFFLDGIEIGQMPDVECTLVFDEIGDLSEVIPDDLPLYRIDKYSRGTNEAAIWKAASAYASTARIVIEVEAELVAFEAYDNSPDALRRELGHLQSELV
jgi:hypothetical protein